MLCQFVPTQQPHQFRCQQCGLLLNSPHAPERIISRCAKSVERAEPPSLPRRAWNLARSLAAFVADGLQTVDLPTYAARLHVCDTCEHRQADVCGNCGCRLSLKARGRAFDCPLGKWPKT